MRYFLVSQKFNKLSINKLKNFKKIKNQKKNLVSPFKLLYYIYLLVYNWINFSKIFYFIFNFEMLFLYL